MATDVSILRGESLRLFGKHQSTWKLRMMKPTSATDKIEMYTDEHGVLHLKEPAFVPRERMHWYKSEHDDNVAPSEGSGWYCAELANEQDEWGVWRDGELMAKCYCEKDADVIVDQLRDQTTSFYKLQLDAVRKTLSERNEQVADLEMRLQDKEAGRQQHYENLLKEVHDKNLEPRELVVLRGMDFRHALGEHYPEGTRVHYDRGAKEPSTVTVYPSHDRPVHWNIRWEGEQDKPPLTLMGPMMVKWP